MIELKLKDLERMKNYSPPPRHAGDIRIFRVMPKVGATMFKDFHDMMDKPIEDHRMISVMTEDGPKWSIECRVIL